MKKLVASILISILLIFSIGCGKTIPTHSVNFDIELADRQNEILNLLNELNERTKKPSYNYLKSVTVYILAELPEPIEEEDEYGEITTVEGWQGTGIVIKITERYTYILTNAHVAGKDYGAPDIYVLNEKVSRIPAKVIKFHKYTDLAIIRVAGKLKNKQAIRGIAQIKSQDRIFLVGHHLGRPYIYGEGVLAGHEGSYDLVQIPILFGNSGSGVFDKDGNLVAMVFAINKLNRYSYDTSHGVAINSFTIKYFLYEAGLL